MPAPHRPIPLAYHLTFHTYGTWLHGQAPGSVDHDHNEFGTEFLPVDPELEAQVRAGASYVPPSRK